MEASSHAFKPICERSFQTTFFKQAQQDTFTISLKTNSYMSCLNNMWKKISNKSWTEVQEAFILKRPLQRSSDSEVSNIPIQLNPSMFTRTSRKHKLLNQLLTEALHEAFDVNFNIYILYICISIYIYMYTYTHISVQLLVA